MRAESLPESQLKCFIGSIGLWLSNGDSVSTYKFEKLHKFRYGVTKLRVSLAAESGFIGSIRAVVAPR